MVDTTFLNKIDTSRWYLSKHLNKKSRNSGLPWFWRLSWYFATIRYKDDNGIERSSSFWICSRNVSDNKRSYNSVCSMELEFKSKWIENCFLRFNIYIFFSKWN